MTLTRTPESGPIATPPSSSARSRWQGAPSPRVERPGRRALGSSASTEKPWKLTKGGMSARPGACRTTIEIQTTGGGVIGVLDPSRRAPRRLRARRPQVGTITSAGPSATLQVTPKGGVRGPARRANRSASATSSIPPRGRGELTARPAELCSPNRQGSSRSKPQGGGEPIVGIDRVGEVLNVSING